MTHRPLLPADMRSNAARVKALAAILLVAGLGACASAESSLPCPEVALLDGVDRMTRFRDGEGRDLTDVEFEATMRGVSGTCDYESGGVDVLTRLEIEVRRGPAIGPGRSASFDFFVALLDPSETMIAKEVFHTEVPFEGNLGRVFDIEELEQVVPLPDVNRGPLYSVLIGFQLTEEELAYNRRSAR